VCNRARFAVQCTRNPYTPNRLRLDSRHD
jgi:hypothetical protein